MKEISCSRSGSPRRRGGFEWGRAASAGVQGLGRQRSGPYPGKVDIFILVDACLRCRRIYPVHPERLTYREKDWVRRWNRAQEKDGDV